MMTTKAKTMTVKCWNCDEPFNVKVSLDSKVLSQNDSEEVKKFARTMRLECISKKCRDAKDTKKAPVNMVDNFVGTILGGTGKEYSAKAAGTNGQPLQANGRMPTADEEDWIKLNTEQR